MPTSPAAIVRAFSTSSLRFLDSVNEHLAGAMVRGREADADCVIVMDYQGGELLCWLLVGSSALCGDSAMEHLVAVWNGDAAHAEEMVTKVAIAMAPRLHGPDGAIYCPIREEQSDAWRSFRGEKPMKLEEVRRRAQGRTDRKPSPN